MRWLCLWLTITAILFACDANDAAAPNRDGISGSAGNGGTSGQGGAGNGPAISTDGGGGTTDAGAGAAIVPAGAQITVSGQPVSVAFHVELEDGTVVPGAVWSVDDTRIGSIGSDGVFHAEGHVGGVVTVSATVSSTILTTDLTVRVEISDNPAGLSVADQTTLKAGAAGGDPEFRWLYPYDGTVFPRGLAAPDLQLGGSAADATYLQISTQHFSYERFSGASNPVRITLPEAVWRGLTLTAGASDQLTVTATKRSGAQVSGPVTQAWRIAPASLKGIIYYSTYKTKLAEGSGAIMRVRPGGNAEVVQSGCTVCHSVSANGNVLATGIEYYAVPGAPATEADDNPVDSAAYDLSPDGTSSSRSRSTEGRLLSFAALTPDGSLALTNGIPAGRWPPYVMRGVYSIAGFPSQVVDTRTGQPIAAPSLSQYVRYAQTPAFSPDGTRVAFVNGDRLDQRVLSILDVTLGVSPPAFANLRDVVTQTGTAVAWPTFLPDAGAVIYHEGDSYDSSLFVANNAPSPPQYAELRLVDADTKTVKTLSALNGRSAAGAVYLPYGPAVEGRMNYEPSALPVAVGGYYWVLFTSRRAYGNTIAPGGSVPRGEDAWGNESDPSPRKKIWIAAIDIDYKGSVDPSHPAFYVPGQELEAGNMRAYAALAPCQADGVACESGADCCGGFCRETGRKADGQPILQCVPPPPNTCSNTDELCFSSADCCKSGDLCINNRCSSPPVPR
jgi:hypothetical protein